tara:strand:+ start:310 stop:489 length:180 start_codon:yes stop_codon:yes gene_type:complete
MTTRSVRFHQKRRRRRRYPCCALSGARSEAAAHAQQHPQQDGSEWLQNSASCGLSALSG